MDDDAKQSMTGSRATRPSDISFKEWADILGRGDAQEPASQEQGVVPGQKEEHDVAREEVVAQKRSWLSTSDYSSSSVPSVPSPEVTAISRVQSHDISNHSVLPGIRHGDLERDECLQPPLPIRIHPRTLGAPTLDKDSRRAFRHDFDPDSRDIISRSSSGRARADREVIVTSEDGEEGGFQQPTPLGYTRRASLFERSYSVDTLRSDARHGERYTGGRLAQDIGSSDPDFLDVQTVDVESRVTEEDADRNRERVPNEAGKYNTVLRDWLMHVLEKDDRHDAKVSKNDGGSSQIAHDLTPLHCSQCSRGMDKRAKLDGQQPKKGS